MLRDELWWICCSSYRSRCPRLPTLLLCWRLSPPEQRRQKTVRHISVSSWKAWLPAYIHLDWVLNWICTNSPAEVEAQASFPLCTRPSGGDRRQKDRAAEGGGSWRTTAILIWQRWGRRQLASVRQLCGNSKLGKKEIRDLNSKIKTHTSRSKRRAKCFKIQTWIHVESKMIIYWRATTRLLPFLTNIFLSLQATVCVLLICFIKKEKNPKREPLGELGSRHLEMETFSCVSVAAVLSGWVLFVLPANAAWYVLWNGSLVSDQVLVTANAALPAAGQSEQKGQKVSNQWTPSYKIAFKMAKDKSSGTNNGDKQKKICAFIVICTRPKCHHTSGAYSFRYLWRYENYTRNKSAGILWPPLDLPPAIKSKKLSSTSNIWSSKILACQP